MAIDIGIESGYRYGVMQMLPVTHGQDLLRPEEDLAHITYNIKIGKNPLREIRWASGSKNYFGGIFGRDTAMMIQHEVDHDPKFAREALLVLASLQGIEFNAKSEEEPGKILHELRSTDFPGVEINDTTRAEIAHLGPLFGGDKNGFEAYTSADATGEWIKGAFYYIKKTGKVDILDEKVCDKNGNEKTFRDCLIAGANWMNDTINYGPLHFNRDRSPLSADAPHLLGWQSITGNFINQQLCDSIEANHFPDGSLVNPNGTQYNTGMQGVAYDGLMSMAMAKEFQDNPQSITWCSTAERLREDTMKYLLVPESNLFGMGADTHPVTGEIRRVDTKSITVADTLGSRLLKDGTNPQQFKTIVESHVREFFGPNFWTLYGTRSESLECWDLFQGVKSNGEPAILSGYHLAQSKWDVLNGKFANALMKLHMPHLAQAIDDSNHNGNAIAGCHLELMYVGQNDELGIDTDGTWAGKKSPYTLYPTNEPEDIHGWTVTNENAQIQRRTERERFASQSTSWEYLLEQEILLRLNSIDKLPVRLETPEQIHAARAKVVLIQLNPKEGRHVQETWLKRMGRWNPSELSAVSQQVEALGHEVPVG